MRPARQIAAGDRVRIPGRVTGVVVHAEYSRARPLHMCFDVRDDMGRVGPYWVPAAGTVEVVEFLGEECD